MEHSSEFLAIVDDAKRRIVEITVEELLRLKATGISLRLIDVREDDEWRAGHAQGAEHLGKGVIERDIVKQVPNKSAELVLYCGGGFRSALAADALQKMGYTKVRSLVGGWRAWQDKGLPVEKP
jgi:rhodanese-related sulfurtransferase